MTNVVNIALAQLSWFACVLSAARDESWLGVGVTILVASWHLLNASTPRQETILLVAALVVGFVFDSALVSSGAIALKSGTLVAGWTTPWMLGLWLGFATTLNSSLKWLMARPLLATLAGVVAGPLAYWSGQKLGAIVLGPPAFSLIAIGTCWSATMACFSILTRYLADARTTETAQS